MKEFSHGALGGGGVAAPKDIEVVEQVVKIVEDFPPRIADVEGKSIFIGFSEVRREPAEHLGEGQVRLTVSVIGCRIKDERFSLCVAGCVAPPKIAMQQGGEDLVIGQ